MKQSNNEFIKRFYRLLSYKKLSLLFFVTFLSVTILYQNCAEPIQDLSVDRRSLNDCETLDSVEVLVGQDQGGGKFPLTLATTINASNLQRVVWKIGSETIATTTNNQHLWSPTVSGDYQIFAYAYKVGCSSYSQFGMKNAEIQLEQEQTCPAVTPNITVTSPVQVNQNATVSLTNASSFQTSTIRWTIQSGQDEPQSIIGSDGQASISVSRSVAATYTVNMSALQTCGSNRSASVSFVVNPAGQTTGAAAITGFAMTTLYQNTAIRGSGKDAVYKLKRNELRTLKVLGANIQKLKFQEEGGGTSTCDPYSSSCIFNVLTEASAAGTVPSCIYRESTLTLTGTNGSTTTDKLFTYCPAGQNFYCHMGRLAAKLPSENCVRFTANPNPCTVTSSSAACTAQVKVEGVPSPQSNKVYRMHVIESDGTPRLSAWSCGVFSSTFTKDWPYVYLTAPSRLRLYYGDGADGTNCDEYSSVAQLNQRLTKVGEDLVITATQANLPTNVIVAATANPCSIAAGQQFCASFKYKLQNLSQFGLLTASQRFYVLPVVNGEVGESMNHCQGNATTFTSPNIPWISAGRTEFRLYKGPKAATGDGCIWSTANVNNGTYTLLASLAVTTVCQNGQTPINGFCPSSGGSGTASCSATTIANGPVFTRCEVNASVHGATSGTCLHRGNCEYRCNNGIWEEFGGGNQCSRFENIEP